MAIRNPIPIAILAVAAAATLSPPERAMADAIDGNWCAEAGGRHMSIAGPRIVTPGGQAMQGDYSRHAFTYIVPAAEPGAGAQVAMVLIDDDTIHLRTDTTAVQIWHRCEFVS